MCDEVLPDTRSTSKEIEYPSGSVDGHLQEIESRETNIDLANHELGLMEGRCYKSTQVGFLPMLIFFTRQKYRLRAH